MMSVTDFSIRHTFAKDMKRMWKILKDVLLILYWIKWVWEFQSTIYPNFIENIFIVISDKLVEKKTKKHSTEKTRKVSSWAYKIKKKYFVLSFCIFGNECN